MTLRGKFLKISFLLLALGLGLPAGRVRAQEEPMPVSKEQWVKRLSKITDAQGDDWYVIYKFRGLDSELSYSILREIWNKKLSKPLKQQLLQNFSYDYGEFVMGPNGLPAGDTRVNPHLLDILELGIQDSEKDIQEAALNDTYNIALRHFANKEAYLEWRKSIGNKPLADVERENCRELFTQFVNANGEEKAKLFERISRLSFSSGTYGTSVNGKEVHGVLAHGLTGIRRQMALECGLLDALIPLLKREQPAQSRQSASWFLMNFTPDESFMARIEEEVRQLITDGKAVRNPESYDTLWYLSYYKSQWATDALLKVVETHYPGMYNWMVTNALCSRDDPRVVPSLIAILEDCSAGEDIAVNTALARITKIKPDPDADSDWWRSWWRKNHTQFPPEVANLTVPKLKGMALNVYSIRRKKSEVEIEDDPRRAYYLISSGLIIEPTDKEKKAILKPITRGKTRYVISSPREPDPEKPIVLPKERRPGLLVVLTDSLADWDAQKTRWQEVAAKAFEGKYLIALASPPQWSAKQSPLWLTRRDQPANPNALFNTEAFVADIARDVCAKYPINSDNVFLLGVGAGGPAVYACSLEPATPFRGFALLNAPFHSAQLPSLTAAKSRRYYLLHSRDEKKTPFFFAAAAQETLRKAGATVKLADYQAEPNKPQPPAPEQIGAAIRWLSERKP